MAVQVVEHLPEQVSDVVVELTTITPKLAGEWISQSAGFANRAPRMQHVAALAREMTNGRWMVNGETIKITAEGEIIDGQHRLVAVVKSDVTIQSFVALGVSKAAFATIDKGRSKTCADTLRAMGETNRTQLAAAAGWVLLLTEGHRDEALRRALTDHERIEAIEAHKYLRDSADWAAGPVKHTIGSTAPLAAVRALCLEKDLDVVHDFFRRLAEDINRDDEDPARLLRGALRKLRDICRNKRSGNDHRANMLRLIGLTVTAWNYEARGKSVVLLRWVGPEIPDILSVSPKGRQRWLDGRTP